VRASVVALGVATISTAGDTVTFRAARRTPGAIPTSAAKRMEEALSGARAGARPPCSGCAQRPIRAGTMGVSSTSVVGTSTVALRRTETRVAAGESLTRTGFPPARTRTRLARDARSSSTRAPPIMSATASSAFKALLGQVSSRRKPGRLALRSGENRTGPSILGRAVDRPPCLRRGRPLSWARGRPSIASAAPIRRKRLLPAQHDSNPPSGGRVCPNR
jgi:hypothetical protein